MSGITPQGWLFTMTRDEALDGFNSVHFLKHLLWHMESKLLVIWDGSTIHRNQCIKEFLSNSAAKQIHLERLPAYAPDLSNLRQKLHLAIRRLRGKPHLIQSFFALAGLSIKKARYL